MPWQTAGSGVAVLVTVAGISVTAPVDDGSGVRLGPEPGTVGVSVAVPVISILKGGIVVSLGATGTSPTGSVFAGIKLTPRLAIDTPGTEEGTLTSPPEHAEIKPSKVMVIGTRLRNRACAFLISTKD